METIHRDQPLATDTLTLGLSFKLTLVNVSSNGARTNTDGLRGHVGRHPSRFLGQVRIVCPRMSACMVLSHEENTRSLGLRPKAFRRRPRGSRGLFVDSRRDLPYRGPGPLAHTAYYLILSEEVAHHRTLLPHKRIQIRGAPQGYDERMGLARVPSGEVPRPAPSRVRSNPGTRRPLESGRSCRPHAPPRRAKRPPRAPSSAAALASSLDALLLDHAPDLQDPLPYLFDGLSVRFQSQAPRQGLQLLDAPDGLLPRPLLERGRQDLLRPHAHALGAKGLEAAPQAEGVTRELALHPVHDLR